MLLAPIHRKPVWLEHHASSAGHLYLMVGGKEAFQEGGTTPPRHEHGVASRWQHSPGRRQGPRQHGHEHHRRPAEGLGLGDALGLDLTMLREIFSQTGANSRVLETDGEDMQNRAPPALSAAHAAKDSGIA
jgi:hypothetical protein